MIRWSETSRTRRGRALAALARGGSTSGLQRRALLIALGYALFAGLWIYYSDRAMEAVIADPQVLIRASVYKGFAFVAVTTLLLLVLMRWAFGALETSYDELRANEEELERLNRLYASLSRVNQAIVRTADREELYGQVCRALVEEGGFRMAWTGGLHEGGTRLVPVASFGDTDGYLDGIQVYVDERPEGLGPSGRAFREGLPYICNDIAADPVSRAWRDAAARRGYRAAAAFPVWESGRVVGTLNVYADTVGFFKDREVELLNEVATDISKALDNITQKEERERVERVVRSEREFSSTMIESLPGILYFYDDQGRFLRWNRNFEFISGYSGKELAHMQPLDFFSKEYKGLVQERIAEVFEKGESYVEAPFVTREGLTIPYFFTGRRVEFDGKPCLVGVGIDITERKRAGAALRELTASLERKVAERTEELEAARLRAEAADRIKSAFLATMSHELRTPLNSIIGFTGILLQELAGPLNEEQRKQLGMVRSSARHLLDLINDVLDISKIEAGQLEVRPEPFALPDAVAHVVSLVRHQAERKGLSLAYQIDGELGTVVSDRRRVEQILLNLITNAVKFTERGRVEVRVDRQEGYRRVKEEPAVAAMRIRVSDTGIGIREEDLACLFQPFRQIDTGLSRQHEGTGLGLAICRRLASLLGGEVSAASVQGQGSEFTVILPIEPPGQP